MTVTRKRTEQQFEDLCDVLVADLIALIASGKATAADKSIARQMLLDAGIRANPATISTNKDFFKNLPFKDEENEDSEVVSEDATYVSKTVSDPLIFSPSIKEKSVSHG